MAKSKGEPIKWITVKGRRVPIYEDGSMGGFMEGKKATSKQEDDKKSGKKTYRVYFEDGNQKLLEANSEEELDTYLKDNEKEIGKATKKEHAKEYDEKKESKSLEDHSDIQKIAEEHVKKIWNGGAANRELYDAAEKWAEEHNFDKTKAKDAAFAAMNKKQMAEIKKRESDKSIKVGNKTVGVKKENFSSKSVAQLYSIDMTKLSSDEFIEFSKIVNKRSNEDGMLSLQARVAIESNRRFFAKHPEQAGGKRKKKK